MISAIRSRAVALGKNPQKGFLFLIVALALCAGAIVIWVTPWGPWTGSDSVVYLLSAKNLVDKGFLGIIWGQGSVETLVHYPPLLTLVVAGLYLFGLDLVSAMRVICAVSLGLLILAAGLLSYKITRLRGLSIQICLILIALPTIFRAYTSAMSEGLFYLCMLTALLMILAYLENQRMAYLLGSALLAAAALLTRYIGIAVLGACLAGILLLSRTGWKKRLLDALVFGVVAILISSPWFFWVFIAKGQLGGRFFTPTMSLGIASSNFKLALSDLIWNWMTLNLGIPATYDTQKIVIAAIFVSLTILIYLVYRSIALRATADTTLTALARWIVLFGLATVLYIVCYFFAYAFTFPTPALIERIAFPIFLTLAITILGLLHISLLLTKSPRWVNLIPWIFTIVLIVAYLPKTISLASDLRNNGGGYTSRAWRQSKMIQAIRNLPDEVPIVTNEADAVILLTGRQSIRMSEALGKPAQKPDQSYGNSTDNFGESVFKHGGALAIFPSFYWQIQPIYGKQTQSRLEAITKGLAVYELNGDNSGIYFYSPEDVP